MVEFGAGSFAKARVLLGAAEQVSAYVPVDISGEFLSNGVGRLREEMPKLPVLPVAADFTKPFELPAGLGAKPRVGFFPGSTIGNFEPHEAHAFLRHAAALLGPGALLIIGVDTSAANVRMASFTGRSRGLNAKFMIFLSPFTRNA
jgi:uncharacterized SAM-dependent methyltransferase